MNVPFLDLKRINENFAVELSDGFKDVLESGWYIHGKHCQAFEKEFSQYLEMNNCWGVGNGLDALRLILEGYKILGRLKAGDEIAVPANTYIATILAIIEAGMKPLLIEPHPDSYNIDPEDLKKKISKSTKGLMVVHLYGQACEMEEITRICKQEGLLLFEDCAQSHGAKVSGKMTGAWGDASAFSFYPGKNLGALGDGGAIVSNDLRFMEVVEYLRNYGSRIKYQNKYVGVNSRLDELQAAFLRVKLRKLNEDNQLRRDIASVYLSEIKNSKVMLPKYSSIEAHVWHLFVLRVQNRERVIDALKAKGIQTMVHYPIPPHKQEALSFLNKQVHPITEKIHSEVLSLPLYPYMSKTQVTAVIEAVNSL